MFYIFLQTETDITSRWVCWDSKATLEAAHDAALTIKQQHPEWQVIVMEFKNRY